MSTIQAAVVLSSYVFIIFPVMGLWVCPICVPLMGHGRTWLVF